MKSKTKDGLKSFRDISMFLICAPFIAIGFVTAGTTFGLRVGYKLYFKILESDDKNRR